MAAQRIVCVQMAVRLATYRLVIPIENAFQKAHLFAMWNKCANPVRTDQHLLVASNVDIEPGGGTIASDLPIVGRMVFSGVCCSGRMVSGANVFETYGSRSELKAYCNGGSSGRGDCQARLVSGYNRRWECPGGTGRSLRSELRSQRKT